jgi:hypothetical protein
MRNFVVAAMLVACGGSADDKPGGVAWPAQPADGTPVVVEFVAITGPADRLEAKLRVFSFTDKVITKIDSRLTYVDRSGDKLQEVPWSWAGAQLLAPRTYKDKTVGATMPDGAHQVTAIVQSVGYADGSRWP